MSEFSIIEHYFKQRSKKRDDVILGIGDDCALLTVPAQQTLVTSMDTLIEGVHFPVAISASHVGYKALAVSLSDLAAMGAEPAWVMLALTMPQENSSWLEAFCEGFFVLCDHYGLQLVGGDTTRGALSITTQVMGFMEAGQAVLRSGARVGDKIFVTGSLGGAGLGLMAHPAVVAGQKAVTLNRADLEASLTRLHRPQARVAAGKVLRGLASAMIDISDGLLADLGHILEASGVAARIGLQNLPLDPVLKNNLPLEIAYSLALSAGDDYELCFTVPEDRCEQLTQVFTGIDCGYHCIGVIEAGEGLRVLDESGHPFSVQTIGYQHFK